MRIENNILIAECTVYDFKGELEKKKIRDWPKSISAFANSYGGSLFYGVDRKGRIVGIIKKYLSFCLKSITFV